LLTDYSGNTVRFYIPKIFIFKAEWVESTSNHFWWSLSTCGGNPNSLIERFQSIVHHVVNKHHWPGCSVFKKCSHKPLPNTVQRQLKWMKPGSEAHKQFRKIILHINVKKDLGQMSTGSHTTLLEVFSINIRHIFFIIIHLFFSANLRKTLE